MILADATAAQNRLQPSASFPCPSSSFTADRTWRENLLFYLERISNSLSYFSSLLYYPCFSMYAIYRELHPPTGVEHCLECNFFDPKRKSLAVAAASVLKVYDLCSVSS